MRHISILKSLLVSLPFFFCMLAFGQIASAGTGAATGVLPNNASLVPSGARTPWTMVSACYTPNCMKGRNTFSYVYVPEGTTNFTMTIIDGCFLKDNDAAFFYNVKGGLYEEGSSSTYTEYHMYPARVINATNPVSFSIPSPFPSAISADYLDFTTKTNKTNAAAVCPNGRRDIAKNITVNPALAPLVDMAGSKYRVFVFHARANTTFYYTNQFRLSANSGVLLGFSSINITLDGENFWTAVSSAKFNSGNNPKWQFQVEFASPCTASPTIFNRSFAWFDADNNVYQFNDELKYEITELNRITDVPTGRVDSGILTGGNNITDQVSYNYSSSYKYRLRIYGIAAVNSQQFRLPFDQIYANANCPVNSAPTGTLSFTCNASGTVTMTVTAGDAQGDVVTLSGNIPAAAKSNNTATATGGTLNTPAGGALTAFPNATPATFAGKRDNIAHSVTLTLKDPAGLSSTITDDVKCALPPPPTGTLSFSCTGGGVVTLTATADNLDGGVVRLSGTIAASLINEPQIAVTGSVTTVVNAGPKTFPETRFNGVEDRQFRGLRDNVPHTITLTLTNRFGYTTAISGSYTCVNTAPTGTLTIICNGVGVATVTASADDAEGGLVRLTGTIPKAVTTNPSAMSVSGRVRTTIGAPAVAFANIQLNPQPGASPNKFNGILDGNSHPVTLTLTDDGGLTKDISTTYTCTNTAPTGSFTLTCAANNGIVSINAKAGDLEGGTVTLTGTLLHSGAGAVTTEATDLSVTGSVATPVGGAQVSFPNVRFRPSPAVANLTFNGIRDNLVHPVNLAIKDTIGATTNISATYKCPNLPNFAVNCSDANLSPEPGELFLPRMSIARTGVSAEVAHISVNMSINNMAGITRSATVDSSATNTTYRFFDSPGDTAVISPPDIGVAFGGVNSGILLPALGNHTVTYDWSYWTATIPLTTSQCIVDVTVQGKPYFKVNGDLSSTSGAPIKAFNKADPLITYLDPTLNDRTGKSGSSAQGIIVGSNVIEGVSSGAFFPLLGIKPLTFANTGATAPANTLFGGGFGVSGFSLPSVDSNAVPYNALDDLASGSFINAGDLSFGENIPAGIHITIFVTGDLTIGSDIIYNDAGGYATFGDIPHVKFVVLKNGAGTGGNVYINGSVKQIDAEIIAETSIDTCMEATWVDCNTPLVVNGALASAKIALNRLNGTLRSSTPDDGKIVAGVYTNAANIGELIQFTPELYLSTPGEPQTVPPGNHYDSITSLPPRF